MMPAVLQQPMDTTGDGVADTMVPVQPATTFQVVVPAGAIAG